MKVGKKSKKKGTIIHTTRTKSFVVTHYAGEVEYNDWKNFYARSVDVLSTHLADTFGRSSNVILSTLFKRKGTENKKKKKISVGKQFQLALTDLVTSITATNVHYIRCLKSNIEQDQNRFDAKYVAKQMTQAGLPAAGEILVAGYPHKSTHLEFYTWNRDVVPALNGRSEKERFLKEPKAFCRLFCNHIQKEFNESFKSAVVGKSLVMMGIEENKTFVQFRNSRLAVVTLQASCRGRQARQRYSMQGISEGKLRRQSTVTRYDSMKDLKF